MKGAALASAPFVIRLSQPRATGKSERGDSV